MEGQDQGQKLIELAHNAKTKFENQTKSTNTPGFAQEYKVYWEERKKKEVQEAIRTRQDETILRLNDIACNQIEERALEIHGNSSEPLLKTNLNLSKQLPSDKVGLIDILNLSSESAINKLSQPEFEHMMVIRILPSMELSSAKTLLNEIRNSLPESGCIRRATYKVVAPININLIFHHGLGFIEKTVRHFNVDLMGSPQAHFFSPVINVWQPINITIYTVNKFFVANNYIYRLRLYCNKTTSLALAEFSDGSQTYTTTTKDTSDINKLYHSLKVMIDNIPGAIPSTVYCVRFFDNNVYFEHLFKYKNEFYVRNVDCVFKCPTTIRLIQSYCEYVPKMLQWKEAVVNQALKYEDRIF